MQLGKVQQVENVVDIEIDETVAKATVETVQPVEVRENETVNA